MGWAHTRRTGRPKKLDVETVAKIQQELSEPEGFISYQEIQCSAKGADRRLRAQSALVSFADTGATHRTTKTALLSALLACQDLEISYSTRHRVVRYELRSKLKVPRPTHEKQAQGVVEAFKQFLPKRIDDTP